MGEKPILFNTQMVRAILAGKKTETRRLVKNQIPELKQASMKGMYGEYARFSIEPFFYALRKAAYEPGDILYVRETWNGLRTGPKDAEKTTYWYRADEDDDKLNPDDIWRPSIHMPKAAARIWLRVTEVRCERLKEITDSDAVHEGFEPDPDIRGVFMCSVDCIRGTPRGKFALLWNDTIPKDSLEEYGWMGNPWVWVYTFERIDNPREAKA